MFETVVLLTILFMSNKLHFSNSVKMAGQEIEVPSIWTQKIDGQLLPSGRANNSTTIGHLLLIPLDHVGENPAQRRRTTYISAVCL